MRGLFYFGAMLLVSCGGCALIPLATLGPALDIAGTAASTGPEVYGLGKLDRAVMASDGDCRRAVREAVGDLRLRIVVDGRRGCGQQWSFELRDERKSEIEITVERRTAMLCLVRVDVGIFGSEPIARLVMEVIESHLPRAATRPAHEEG